MAIAYKSYVFFKWQPTTYKNILYVNVLHGWYEEFYLIQICTSTIL